MAKKPTVTTVASGYYGRQALNDNFEALRDAFDNTLSRDGSTPNAMGADFDMNGYRVLNAGQIDTDALYLNGVAVRSATDVEFQTTYLTASYTGDGSTVAYSLTANPQSEGNVSIYIDGVYQNKDTFSLSGTTITFSEAPPLNSAIEIVYPSNTDTVNGSVASAITYNQGGTGAQDRTVKQKLQEFVSVKDFGAVGDGVADDTAAIQRALNYSRDGNGATIFFPAGTYKYTGTMYVCSNTTLLGEALGAVEISQDNSGTVEKRPKELSGGEVAGLFVTFSLLSRYRLTATNDYLDWSTAPSIGSGSDYVGPHTNVRFKNLIIKGTEKASNKHQVASGTPVAGDVDNVDVIAVDDATNVVIEDCNIPFAAECAIRFSGNTSTADAGACDECRVLNIVTDDVGKGVEASQNAINVKISNSHFPNSDSHAIRLSNVQQSIVTGCFAKSNNGSAVLYANQGKHILIGNELDLDSSNTERVITINGATSPSSLSTLISGNIIHRNSIGSATNADNSRTIIIKDNIWLNESTISQGESAASFETNPSGFIFFNGLDATETLIVDDVLWNTSSTRKRFVFGPTANIAGNIELDAIIGDGDLNTQIAFDGSDVIAVDTNGAECARFTSTGYLIGTDSPTIDSSNAGVRLDKSGFTAISRLVSSGSLVAQIYGSAGSVIVRGDGDLENTNGSYGAISDEKLKQNIVDASSQWQDIKDIRVRNYRLKSNPDGPTYIGVIAQELEATSPNLVKTTNDVDADGNENGETTKSVKYSILYMKAVKALQEAIDRIEQLETRVQQLEAE